MTATLPHWDMTVVYPGLESSEFADSFRAMQANIAALQALFDEVVVPQQPAPFDEQTRANVERVLERINAVLEEVGTIEAYIFAFVSTDSRNDTALARLSELQQQESLLSQLMTRFTAWIGSLDVEALIERSPLAAGHSFALRQAKERSAHLMSPIEEALAAELRLTGSSAWSTLNDTFTAQIAVPLDIEGQPAEAPMSVVRNLASHPDRSVRQRAYQAELAAWQRHAVPIAAALNSIKGEVNALARRRGWDSPLDQTLFDASMDREILDAMMNEARASFPDFRRYLRAKARALKLPRLAWYDLFAPLNTGNRSWSFDEARDYILTHFGAYGAPLQQYAARAFREHWIDAEPRAGKQGGAFCMPLRRDESRILANYETNYGGMSTLAHELGHGYHNVRLAARTALQKNTPMTLAETASIFCETLVKQAALKDAGPAARMEILEASLQDQCQVVVDITSRFLFEQQAFERRQARSLSVEEFCEIMLEAQRATYGDSLEERELHPYMWAAKGHYYSGDLSFYNFPYMFGLLFGLGLYAHYQADSEAFKRSYDDLLSSTGLADAGTLAARFGIDLRAADFWRSSLDIIRQDINRFGALVDQDTATER
ncbi:MAG TPA: M3 family oligoendopeptidase [Ktedonobacterales bacterium]